MTEKRRADLPSVREIEFALSETTYPFVSLSEEADCRIDLVEILPRSDGRYAEFFTITDAEPSQILERTDAYEIDVRLLSEYRNGGLFEFRVTDDCPAVTLSELGALPRTARSVGGSGRLVAEVPPQNDAVTIVNAFLDAVPRGSLVAKRKKDELTPLFSGTAFRQALRSTLTDRQFEVLEAAFGAGYYDWPRECSGEEVAAELGITSPTFSQHIHAAERKLLAMLFENPCDSPDGR